MDDLAEEISTLGRKKQYNEVKARYQNNGNINEGASAEVKHENETDKKKGFGLN